MATATRPWIRADLERLPDDGNRYEVLDGALFVTPLPTVLHQRVAANLAHALGSYLRRHRIGFIVGPGAIPKGENELQPDLMVILDSTVPMKSAWAALPAPALVVEILSPPTSRRDVTVKRAAYRRWKIPEYWIVDPEGHSISVVRPGRTDEQVRGTLYWRPLPDLVALAIPVSELFA